MQLLQSSVIQFTKREILGGIYSMLCGNKERGSQDLQNIAQVGIMGKNWKGYVLVVLVWIARVYIWYNDAGRQ